MLDQYIFVPEVKRLKNSSYCIVSAFTELD